MRNPNRTTKGERRFVRRYNPYAARVLGVAEAARWYRKGILLDEAQGFDNLVNDLMYGPVPLDLNDRVTAALGRQRDALERNLGIGPGMLTPTSSNANHYSAREPMFTVMTDLETDDIIEVHQLEPGEWQATVDAMTRVPGLLALPESIGGGTFEVDHPEPLGPSACGHYEVVDMAINADVLAMPESWFAKYEAYRAGLDLGPGYVAWDGEPWRDPNEVAAAHAEAIDNALNDDIDPGE